MIKREIKFTDVGYKECYIIPEEDVGTPEGLDNRESDILDKAYDVLKKRNCQMLIVKGDNENSRI